MVLQIFRRAPAAVEVKASAAAPLVAFQGAGRAAWSARDTQTLTRVGFLGNPVAFRCVKIIAEAAAAVPVVVQDATRRFDVHPVLELLAAPNPGQGGAALLEAFYGHLLLSGDGYIEAAGMGPGGGPRELYVLRSDRMKVVPGADGWPVAYEYSVGASKHRLRHAAGPGAGAARQELPSAGRSLRAVAAERGGERDRRAQFGEHLVEGAARQRGAAVGGDRLQGRGRDGAAGLGPVRAAGRRAGDAPPGGAERRAADAARRRARLEADGVLAVGHGVSPHQGGGGARRGAGLRGAADAARAAGRQYLRQLFRGASGVLPADGAAAGREDDGGGLGVAAGLVRDASSR